jgi:hypothetical protein
LLGKVVLIMVREVNERMSYVEAKNSYPKNYILMKMDEGSDVGVVICVGEIKETVDKRLEVLDDDENFVVLEGVNQNSIGGLW